MYFIVYHGNTVYYHGGTGTAFDYLLRKPRLEKAQLRRS